MKKISILLFLLGSNLAAMDKTAIEKMRRSRFQKDPMDLRHYALIKCAKKVEKEELETKKLEKRRLVEAQRAKIRAEIVAGFEEIESFLRSIDAVCDEPLDSDSSGGEKPSDKKIQNEEIDKKALELVINI